MHHFLRHAGHAGRFTLRLALCAAVLPAAWASYATLQPPQLAPAHAPLAVSMLAPEFGVIRPAGEDGSAPPIPPSELWPAQ